MINTKSHLRVITLLTLLILTFSSCDSDGGGISNDEFQRGVAEEAVAILERHADVVEQDCGQTFISWQEIDKKAAVNNMLAYRPGFDESQQNRVNSALGTIQDTLARCWPDSDFRNPDMTEADTAVDCNKMCPISDWHCFVFVMECGSGDNQACCFSGACTGNCLDTCNATDGCQDVCPNGPNGP